MRHKKSKQESAQATQARVKREMAKPRMARSARIAQQNLDPMRVPDQSSATMPGIVEKVILSLRSSKPERAQIGVHDADKGHRNLRIENVLTDENGDDVRLKKGAHVDVTVAADHHPAKHRN